jgi:hypothetical protein
MVATTKLAIALTVWLMSFPCRVTGQALARADSGDVHYYDGWPGVWHRVQGEWLDSLPTFEVRRGPGNSFLEDWYLVIDGKRSTSFGLRSWDPETKSWRLSWVSDSGLFQIWDGIKLKDGWYIVRKFGEGADAFLSRQAWIPHGTDRLLHTIERSTDGGRTWTVRYRDLYLRVRPNP